MEGDAEVVRARARAGKRVKEVQEVEEIKLIFRVAAWLGLVARQRGGQRRRTLPNTVAGGVVGHVYVFNFN